MSRDADLAGGPSVQYDTGGNPHRIEVRTQRWQGDSRFTVEYAFSMTDSIAELVTIEPDTPQYNWPANDETREVAAEVVADLPFVTDVVMPGVADE